MVQVVSLLTAIVLGSIAVAAPAGGDDSPRGGGIDAIVDELGADADHAVIIRGTRATTDLADDGLSASGSQDDQRVVIARGMSPAAVRAMFARACSDALDCSERTTAGLNPMFLPAAVPADAEETGAAAPARVVTIEDLAEFLPATVTLHAEPDGWAVVGVPANFWTYVKPITVDGELLGESAAVRFSPRLYEWRYGDGGTRVTQSGGASWSGLGQEELTATSTSHVYAAKATVRASVTVVWSAEYRFAGSDWIAVAGAVSNSSPEQRMLVVKERTVLTAR